MKKNKDIFIVSILLISILLLSFGTIAYFRRSIRSNVNAKIGKLTLVVNDKNSSVNEAFSISLNRSEEEAFVLPDDKGVFNLEIDSTGSSDDVYASIVITRTNLPENLKFYLDEKYTQEVTSAIVKIEKADTMKKTLSLYWFWDGSVDDANDMLFIGKTITANISVSAKFANKDATLYNTIADQYYNLGVTTGNGIMMFDETRGQEFPVLYYNGDTDDNNVIYDGFCWLIVRTTETGGVKLIYNGPINSDGSCNNFSGVTSTTPKNDANDDIVGYINNTLYLYNDYFTTLGAGYMYNDNVNSLYFPDTNTFDADKYNLYLSDYSIDSETGRHTQNKTDSIIKGVVDEWYETNIMGKLEENLLEDTIWCNDRSVTDEEFSIENFANGVSSAFKFSSATRISPSLVCNRDIDKFTVHSENGNGDLTYPIGLITKDEAKLCGFWLERLGSGFTMSPAEYSGYGHIKIFTFNFHVALNKDRPVRPSISLKNEVILGKGNGSFETPYVVGPVIE